jgi:hypothetical protein
MHGVMVVVRAVLRGERPDKALLDLWARENSWESLQ